MPEAAHVTRAGGAQRRGIDGAEQQLHARTRDGRIAACTRTPSPSGWTVSVPHAYRARAAPTGGVSADDVPASVAMS
jgi:hypothetical protein